MASKVSWKTDERLQRILKQNAETRARERYKDDSTFNKVVAVLFVLSFFCSFFALVAIGVVGLILLFLFIFVGGILAVFAVSSVGNKDCSK